MNYFSVIMANPSIRALWLTQFFVGFGAWFTNVAVYSLLASWGQSAFVIACFTALHLIPGVLQAPFSGPLIEKSNPKILLITLLGLELVTTLFFLTINSPYDLPLMALLVFFKMSAASLFFTAQMTLIPKLAREEELVNANHLFAITWSLTFVLGMALGGIVTEYGGYKTAFILDALMFCIAFFFLFSLPHQERPTHATDTFFSLIVEGWRYLRGHKKIVRFIILHATIGLTSFDALVTLLAQYHYAKELALPLAIGWVNAVRALGLMIGPLLFGRYANDKALRLAFWAQGVTIILWAGLQFSFTLSLIGTFLVGLCTATIWSVTYALIQKECDEAYLGRIVAYNDMVFLLANIVVSLLIGFFAGLGTPLWAITIVLGCGFLITAYYHTQTSQTPKG